MVSKLAAPFVTTAYPVLARSVGTTEIEVGAVVLAHLAAEVLNAMGTPRVRGVVVSDVADLGAFTVAADGFDYVQDDAVLLPAQSVASERGPWIVGVVGGGTAPLTRPTWWASGSTIKNGATIEIDGSSTERFGGTTWKAMCTGVKVVDTDDPVFYPRTYRGLCTLVDGTKTHGAGGDGAPLFVYSTRSAILFGYANPVASYGTTVIYPSSVTLGVAGTAAILIDTRHYTTGTTDGANDGELWVVVHN